jgi:hypothetical protein
MVAGYVLMSRREVKAKDEFNESEATNFVWSFIRLGSNSAEASEDLLLAFDRGLQVCAKSRVVSCNQIDSRDQISERLFEARQSVFKTVENSTDVQFHQ